MTAIHPTTTPDVLVEQDVVTNHNARRALAALRIGFTGYGSR